MTCAAACALLLSLGACGRTSISSPLASTLAAPQGAEIDEIEFWHELPTRTVVANGDALLGLLFLGTGGSANAGDAPVADLIGADYDQRIAYAKHRGWLPQDFDEPAELAIRRGAVARALADICRVRGGVMMQVLGPTERYSARELEYLGIMPPGSPNQVVAGGEFIGLISQAQDYINFKRIEPLPGVRATLNPDDAAPAPSAGPDTAVAGHEAGADATAQPGVLSTEAPAVVVVFDAGRPADPASMSSGVRLAAWEDGTTLIAADQLNPASDLRVGAIAPEQLAAVLQELELGGFFTESDSVLVAPDSAFVRVTARSGSVTRTHMLDAHHQSHAAWWPRAAIALERLRPADTRPIADEATDGQFRGYVLAEWWRTAWLKK